MAEVAMPKSRCATGAASDDAHLNLGEFGMIVRRLFFILAVALAARVAHAQEGLQIDDAHRQVKAVVQKDRPTKQELDQVVAALNRMIAENEQRFGKTSAQVGVLLFDIGEAAIKREYVSTSAKERLETLRRGIRALDAGDAIVRTVESQYPAATISRARGRRLAGIAYGKLDDTAASERAYREGLEIHRRRFGDHSDQLAFFEPLDAVSPAGAVRLETARMWLRIATAAGNRRQAELANGAVKTASQLVSPVVGRADAARRSAEALANSGKREEAYAALAGAFQSVRTAEERTIFTARVKPSVFFVYQDLLAPKKTGWDHSEKAVPVYDLVATRFLVDKGLQPFVEEGRNNLLGLLINLRTIHEKGSADDARYFCRIVPGGYTGYGGSGFPSTCDGTPSWASWSMSMGSVDEPRRLLALGMDLAEKELAKGPSATAGAARTAAHIALTDLEARYGSPDAFLTELDRVDHSGAGQRIPPELIFYAGMLRDDPAEVRLSFQRAGGYDKLSGGKERDSDNSLKNKLYLTGARVAAFLCADDTLKVPPPARAVQCERAGLPIPDALLSAVRSGQPGAAADSSELAAMPELVSVMKLAGPPKPAVNPPIVRGRQPLPNADPLIIQRSLSSKSAREQGFLEGARYDSNYEAIANAFARQGKLALARDWAAMAVVQDASANGPATIFTAWLAEGHAESQQRRGWTELAGGNPIMADALFSIPVDAELRPADPSSREEKTSFDWTRVIGAFQGRMMARQALGDLEGAKADARAFVAYTQRALQRQSFTRFETRDLVARFARPALLVAVQTLVGPSGRLERQTSPQDFNTIFEALQLMKPSSTGATVTRLAARLSQRSTDLAVAARSREELRLRWDAARLDAIREASDKKAALVRSLGQELSEMDRRIAVAYPAYVNLTGTTAVTVDRTIDALGKDQVLIAYAFASRDAYLVALSAVGGRIVRLDKSLEEIRKVALAVRQSIEPQAGQFVRFRNEDASRLSELALRPVWDLVATPANRILVTVPDGPIDGLPLSILPAPGEPASFVIDKVATSRLPSISSLVLLRTFGAPPAGQQQPFIGIGDPILEGNPAQRRGLSVGDVSADRKVIDVRKLRALPRLPETADEITRLAKLFGSGSDAIVLGAAATEAKIRALPFASFRTIAFATHGLVAGELSSFNEPGLVLTPPAQPSGDDDGFLSASEISALDLRADLVLLSACNTASTDGKEGTDGLSGLAKAFFFAGARNLLVSHWSVESSAATHLTTAMIQSRQAGSAPTYAEALRSAIVSLKAKSTRQAAHPGFWGAFEVIGN